MGLGGGMRLAKHRDRWAVGLSIWDAKKIIIFGRIKPLRDERNKQREDDEMPKHYGGKMGGKMGGKKKAKPKPKRKPKK